VKKNYSSTFKSQHGCNSPEIGGSLLVKELLCGK